MIFDDFSMIFHENQCACPPPPRLFFRLCPFRGFAHVALSTVCGAWLSPLLSLPCLAFFASFPSFSFCSLCAHPADCSSWDRGLPPGSARALVWLAARLCSGPHCLPWASISPVLHAVPPYLPLSLPLRRFPRWRLSSFTLR